ncbi:MAG TPA: LytTR family DNA-binding domain-containing protein [Verrucomicrobiota bacterium]|nr:DNA-binding response regulator [Verrucomicrobiales bacterium]HRI13718.1 LytTR family DNA-binding domain-containing protein [Verrucomicrobiota bacterium]
MTSTLSTLRVLTVDDEPLGRERLRNFLAQEQDVTLVGEAASGDEAVEQIRSLRPDLVFLDVQLPGCTGFGVLEKLGAEVPPAVVFVTAHDQFALRAFDVHAVDYLLKPFDRGRFKTALHRAVDRLRTTSADDLTSKLHAVIAQLQPRPAASPDRIPVKTGGKVIFVNVPEIDWVGSADNYVELHVGTHTHLIRETLTAMEHRLPGERFVRISRTTIVNTDRVKELQPLFHGEYSVTLRDGTRLTLSRTYRDQLSRLGMT